MTSEAPDTLKNHREKQNLPVEVVDAEKRLWTLINSKGLLNKVVQELYRNVRTGYENIILNDHEIVEVTDAEYSLWKLHYKHIDEFRKRLQQRSANSEVMKSATPQDVASLQKSIDSHMEGFNSFLSEAAGFYEDLITKLRRCYGLSEELFLYKKGGGSFSVEPTKLDQCHFLHHRFLVCLGDLARYKELHKRPGIQNRNWSVAATYYFEAAVIWPDGGSPQNQLALLAIYVGDDFLALYHCIRSLAVKEPFPDAWDNLMLLFEKNRSCHLHSLSSDIHFDFLKPFERIPSQTKSYSSGGSSNRKEVEATDHVSSGKDDLCPLFVRMISFFFVQFSLEDFTCTFASTMRELEILMSLDDTKLNASLESYDHMDSGRKGPYRALQIVSILIFIVHNLADSSRPKEALVTNHIQQSALIQWALTATFICMGRLLERSQKCNHLEFCPLLPAVLVFVEWLVSILDKAEMYSADEKVASATSYFFGAFAELLNQLDVREDESKSPERTALWEDYELRGFAPIGHVHASLDFTCQLDHMGNFDSNNLGRASCIFHSAMKILDRSVVSKHWLFYDRLRRKFYTAVSTNFPVQKEAEVVESDSSPEETYHHDCKTTKECEKVNPGENHSQIHAKQESIAIEEDEIILFKPITRHNSAPLSTYMINDQMSTEGTRDQTPRSDERLRHAASLFIAQTQALNYSGISNQDTFSFRCNKPFKQQEPPLKDSATLTAGPPSLSAWVLNRESTGIEREKEGGKFSKHELSPIQEIPSASLSGLSLGVTEPVVGSDHISSTGSGRSTTAGSGLPPSTSNFLFPPPYLAPMPSAPLLPDDAVWFKENTSSLPEHKSSVGIKEADGILGAAPVNGYANLSPTRAPFDMGPGIRGFNPPVLGMSSSEWLYWYRNNQNLDRVTNHISPVYFNSPGNLGNLYGHDPSRFDLFDLWGNPMASNRMVYMESPQLHPGSSLVYGAEEQRKETPILGYQRTSPYGCGAGTDIRAEQPPHLHYVKDREWQLQRESQVRGPPYMGN